MRAIASGINRSLSGSYGGAVGDARHYALGNTSLSFDGREYRRAKFEIQPSWRILFRVYLSGTRWQRRAIRGGQARTV